MEEDQLAHRTICLGKDFSTESLGHDNVVDTASQRFDVDLCRRLSISVQSSNDDHSIGLKLDDCKHTIEDSSINSVTLSTLTDDHCDDPELGNGLRRPDQEREDKKNNDQRERTKDLCFPAEQLDDLFYIAAADVATTESYEINRGRNAVDEETGPTNNNVDTLRVRIDVMIDREKLKSALDGIITKIKSGRIKMTVSGLKDAITTEISSIITGMPDKMKKVPPTIIKFTKKTVKGSSHVAITAERIGEEAIRSIAELPKKASPTWRGNLMTFAVLVTVPSLIALTPYLIGPLLSPVDEGYQANKTFVWGYKIPFEALQIYPFIELCNQAMPKVQISIRSRLITLMVSIALVKAFQYIVWIEGIFTNGQSVFPFPLSPVADAFVGSIPVVPLMYILSPRETRYHFNFVGMLAVIATLWLTALLGLVWVVGIFHTHESSALQNVVAGLFGLIVYVCRIEVGSKTIKKVNEDRWPQMNATGSIILFNFQFYAYPYIRGPIQLCFLFTSQMFAMHWKIWAVADRFVTAGRRLVAVYAARRANEITTQELPIALSTIAQGLFRESHFDAIEAKQSDIGQLVRSMTSETLEISFSVSDHGIAEERRQHIDRDFDGDTQGRLSVSFDDCSDEDDDDDEEEEVTSADCNSIFRHHMAITTDVDSSAPTQRKKQKSRKDSESSRSMDARFAPAQRYIYLLMEAINTVVLFIITRLQQETKNILLSTFGANSSISGFRVPIRSSTYFLHTQLYGWSGIAFMILVLTYLTWQSQRRVDIHYKGEKLTMSKILAYSFSKNFWLYFWWLSSMSLSASMGSVKHWGFDNSFHFKYFDCLDNTNWPVCPGNP